MRTRKLSSSVVFALVCLIATFGISMAFLDELPKGYSNRYISGKKHFDFVGYWEGIDEKDGAISNLSIRYDSERTNGANGNTRAKGAFKILSASAGIVLFCDETSGFSRGTAQVRDGILVSTDRVIVCLDDIETENSSPVAIIPDQRNDSLILTFPSRDRGPIVFHRLTGQRNSRIGYGLK